MLRREFIAGLGMLSLAGSGMARAAVKNPLPAGGVTMTYRLLFGDSEIGTHKVHIRDHDQAGHVVIEHETKLEVRILFVVAYTLDHRATEVWEGFTLKSVRSNTVENGKKTVVRGDTTDNGFRILDGRSEKLVPTGSVTTDSFWLAAAIDAPRIVNIRTGEAVSPTAKDLGNGRWQLKAAFDHGPIEATVRFDGDFLAEATVDNDGHTIKMERIKG